MDAVRALDESLAGFTRVSSSIGDEDWTRPTPCADWCVAEVFDHVLSITDKFTRFANGSTDTPHGHPLAADDRSAALAEVTAASRAAWSTVDASRLCRLPFGDFTAEEAATVNSLDVDLHTWDIARGVGFDFVIPERHLPDALSTLRRLTSPEAIEAGHYAPPTPATPDSPQDALLIASGRSTAWPHVPGRP